MDSLLFIIISALSVISVKSSESPFIIKDGCPKVNPLFDEENYKGCGDWIMEMCACCNEDYPSGAPTPSNCTIRSPSCNGSGSSKTPSASPSEIIESTPYPTFITTIVETIINKITNEPTVVTIEPSQQPSTMPSSMPSQNPSTAPSDVPSDSPSEQPSQVPSELPTWIATSEDHCPLAVKVNITN